MTSFFTFKDTCFLELLLHLPFNGPGFDIGRPCPRHEYQTVPGFHPGCKFPVSRPDDPSCSVALDCTANFFAGSNPVLAFFVPPAFHHIAHKGRTDKAFSITVDPAEHVVFVHYRILHVLPFHQKAHRKRMTTGGQWSELTDLRFFFLLLFFWQALFFRFSLPSLHGNRGPWNDVFFSADRFLTCRNPPFRQNFTV